VDDTRGEMTFNLYCNKCGSNELTVPDDATDDSAVTCSSCGAELDRWGDVQAAMQKATMEKFTESVTNVLGETFDGSEGITFKKAE
jgi:hypothetical protein